MLASTGSTSAYDGLELRINARFGAMYRLMLRFGGDVVAALAGPIATPG